MTDDWKESVDRQLGQLHSDVRALLLGGIWAFVFLLGAIGVLYVHTDDRFDAVNDRISRIEQQQVRMDAKLDQLLERTTPKK